MRWHRDVGQNDVESDERVDSRGLPIRVADGTGAVNVSEDLAQRRLLRQRDALLGQVSTYNRTVKDIDGRKAYVYLDAVVPASAPADLDPRVSRRQAGLAVVCGAGTAVLIGLQLGWP